MRRMCAHQFLLEAVVVAGLGGNRGDRDSGVVESSREGAQDLASLGSAFEEGLGDLVPDPVATSGGQQARLIAEQLVQHPRVYAVEVAADTAEDLRLSSVAFDDPRLVVVVKP